MVCRMIDGRFYAQKLCDDVKTRVVLLKQNHGVVAKLAILLIGDDPSSQIYVRLKRSKAEELGIVVDVVRIGDEIEEKLLLDIIDELNNDDGVHGILVQLPLPLHISKNRVLNSISRKKDVDGLTSYNVGNLHYYNVSYFIPCTPQGIMMLIKAALGEDIAGKRAVVLGRSIIVGKPVASLLLREDCTVMQLHSQSLDIASETSRADILVVAVGNAYYVKENYVKEGACVIDVGINKMSDGTIKGDVHPGVSRRAGYLSKVPGGVGPMTIACLANNVVIAAYRSCGIK